MNRLKYKEPIENNDEIFYTRSLLNRDELISSNKGINNSVKLSQTKIDIDIEKNKLRRIKSGNIIIEGKVDLHGLSLKEAEDRLKLFVGKSFRLKKRFLLVITGKGKNSKPNIFGKTQTIKSEIHKWVSDGFYNDKLQYISKALDKHGGGGAYYFFLRQSKNIFS